MKNTNTTDAKKQASAPEASEKKPTFDKDLFKRSVLYNVMNMYRKTLEEATPRKPMTEKIPKWYTICPWNF